MKIGAIIAEYNPFHSGHQFQIEQLRKHGVDHIIIIMSGNFTQRGTPAIFDKYTRCQYALENGADLVLELPVFYATGSAELFARGAVSILDQLGVVDYLYFGSESGQIAALMQCADIFAKEPVLYKDSLSQNLKKGHSFPKARSMALSDYLSATCKNDCSSMDQLCNTPNNILGIEYLKELLRIHSHIQPLTLKRQGSDYADTTLPQSKNGDNFASAQAIRSALSTGNLSETKQFIPQSVYHSFVNSSPLPMLFENDFSMPLLFQLLSANSKEQYHAFYDVSIQLSHIIHHNLMQYSCWSDFALSCKSKELTYTRINRCLLHLLLNMKQETFDTLQAHPESLYARVLGFTTNGQEILTQIKQHSDIPLVTKLTHAQKQLNPYALLSLEADLHATKIYEGVRAQKYKTSMRNEFTQQIIRI